MVWRLLGHETLHGGAERLPGARLVAESLQRGGVRHLRLVIMAKVERLVDTQGWIEG